MQPDSRILGIHRPDELSFERVAAIQGADKIDLEATHGGRRHDPNPCRHFQFLQRYQLGNFILHPPLSVGKQRHTPTIGEGMHSDPILAQHVHGWRVRQARPEGEEAYPADGIAFVARAKARQPS
eukprot:CAMPEP_0167805366 /NCGR_PEP_ID=MMETSP0111_2-20121227/21136_1 /TAXON_ID=91324 /ORGANISM="Lotharella globosa, Strain CCCM811" /LENGTH=124 /DNA_ID=CAMNT_0007702507 /DNA_START=140 /DNA_END=515 /DNA_ORIENTATION=+